MSVKKHLLFHPYFLLTLISFLALTLRIIFIDSVPVSTTFDQLHYLLDAMSFFSTGKDISGTTSLLDIFFFHYPTWAGMQAELPYLLLLSSVGPFGLSLVTAALPNIILGVGTVILLFFLGKQLVGNRFGVIAALLGAINPWFIFSQRTAYEVVPATFFYLLALYLFMHAKGKKILFIIPVMLLAFYSYIGTKLIFIPFILACIVYSYYVINKRKYLKEYLAVGITSFIVMALFLFQLSTQPTSRVSDIFLPSHQRIEKEVNTQRQQSLVSPLTTLAENKFTVYGRTLISNTFNLFSPQYLFGEGDLFFSMNRHGLFYYLDALFLIIGTIYFYRKYTSQAIFFGALIGISILPQVFHDPTGKGNFSPHIALLIPFLLLITAYGIETSISLAKKKHLLFGIIGTISLAYVLLVLNFLHIYFNQFPLHDTTFALPNRVLARYIQLSNDKKTPVVVHVTNPLLSFREYIFYSREYSGKNVSFINSQIKQEKYSFKNVTFIGCTENVSNSNAVRIYQTLCGIKNNVGYHSIPNIKDSGSAYEVYNDVVCRDILLQKFVSGLTTTDLAIEKINNENFCRKLIISY